MRRYLRLIAICVASLLSSGAALADYPDRPIKLIVGFPPGGSIDVVARILAEKLRIAFAQPIVVENRPGASGTIAAQSVASADPDGYSILMTTSAVIINPWISPSPFDPMKELKAVTRVAMSPYVLIVNPKLPINSLDDFIAYAKQQPGKLTCSTYGVGSPPHLALEMFKRAGSLDVVHAPYRSFGLALPDLMSGLLSCSVDTPANVEQHVRAGSIKAVAVTSPAALPMFPGAAPMASRYPDVSVEAWQGIFVRNGTAQPIVDRINGELVKALRDPDVIKRMSDIGFTPVGDPSDAAAKVVSSDYERYGALIKSMKLKSE